MKHSVLLIGLIVFINSCSSVKVITPDTYKLVAKSTKRFSNSPTYKTITISTPTSAAGYGTNDMRYVQKPYLVESFAKNTWLEKPANLIQPLITESVQNTGYFKAVVPSSFYGKTTYRLDTELLILQQNFLKKPSTEKIAIRASIVKVSTQKLMASRVFSAEIKTKQDSPYGGVIAANIGLQHILTDMMKFVVSNARG